MSLSSAQDKAYLAWLQMTHHISKRHRILDTRIFLSNCLLICRSVFTSMEEATVKGTWPPTSTWPQAPTTTTSNGRVHGDRQQWPLWINSLISGSRWTCTGWSPLTLTRCPLMVREGLRPLTGFSYKSGIFNKIQLRVHLFLAGTELYWDDPKKVGSKVTASDGSYYYRGPGSGTSTFLSHSRLNSRSFIKGDDAYFLLSLEGAEPVTQ